MPLGRPSFSKLQFLFSIFMAGKFCVHVHNDGMGYRDNAGPSDSDRCLELLHAANFVTQHPADLHRWSKSDMLLAAPQLNVDLDILACSIVRGTGLASEEISGPRYATTRDGAHGIAFLDGPSLRRPQSF